MTFSFISQLLVGYCGNNYLVRIMADIHDEDLHYIFTSLDLIQY